MASSETKRRCAVLGLALLWCQLLAPRASAAPVPPTTAATVPATTALPVPMTTTAPVPAIPAAPVPAIRAATAPATQFAPPAPVPVRVNVPTQAQIHPALPAVPPQNLLAHGTEEFLWIARVVPARDQAQHDVTHIYWLRAYTDDLVHFSDVPARVVSMANSGAQLAVLCDTGTWLLLSDSNTAVEGKKPADSAKLLALANDDQTLWAIAVSSAAPAAAAGPANPAATKPPGPHLVLLVFNGDTWQPADGAPLRADLPADAPLSLAIIDHVRCLAIRLENNTIQIFRQSPQRPPEPQAIAPATTRAAGAPLQAAQALSPWEKYGDPAPAPAAFKLLPLMSPASIWLADANADRLMVLQPSGPGKTVALKTGQVPVTERASLYAIHALREMAVVDGKLVEQDYDTKTFKLERTRVLEFPGTPAPSIFSNLFGIVIAAGLLFAIWSSMRRRRAGEDQITSVENLEIADPARRLLAGLIDAIPFAVPVVILLITPRNPQQLLGTLTWTVAFVVYLVHTAASEALTGRSLGKMVVGLRVVRTDGGTPDAAALLIRNFLRVVDVALFVPLVFILFSPLRQRIGDVAAGTIVIRDRVRPEGTLVEPPEPEEPDAPEAPTRAEPPPAVDGE